MLSIKPEKKVNQTIEMTIEKEQSKFYLTVNVIPEFESKQEIGTYLVVLHDITTRKLFEQEIEKKNKNITESINYAYRIQNSILPDQKILQQYFNKSFVFYKPRDIISGDFPWLFHKGDNIYLAIVDCTGHGVPGALLSFIGYFHLNNIVDHERELSAGEILDELHQKVKHTLKQDIQGATTHDGMDIALCKINIKQKKLEFAGAHRPLYLYRNNELLEFKGDRKAIGGISLKKRLDIKFSTQYFEIKAKDRIFIFSDGLPDQLGGTAKTKYMNKRIKEHIIQVKNKKMTDVGKSFMYEFEQWKSNEKQVDDVLLIGVEF
jgi:serine phosphatase RsbU (regulator of sigma subunit)